MASTKHNFRIKNGLEVGNELIVNGGTISNPSIWINDGTSTGNWNENIRLYDTSQGVSTIAFGAAAGSTSGTPRHSFVSYSGNLSFYYGSSLQEYKYNGYSLHTGSYRAPIFYDSDNTAYYTDPASTSNVNALTVSGGLTLNSSTLYFAGVGDNNHAINYPGGTHVGETNGTQFRFYSYLNLYSSRGGTSVMTLKYDKSVLFNGNATIGVNGEGGGDKGLNINYGVGSGDYGRVRFYENSSNHNVIHSFSNAWQGGSFTSKSSGAININAYNGVTFGHWSDVSHYFGLNGTGYAKADFRAPIFYDSNDTAYYVDPNGTSNLNGLSIGGFAQTQPSMGYWMTTSTYFYDTTSHHYFIKVATMPSNGKLSIEYHVQSDVNYPHSARGSIQVSSFSGGSISGKIENFGSQGIDTQLWLDNSNNVWIRSYAIWNSSFRWRVMENVGCTVYQSGWDKQEATPTGSYNLAIKGRGYRFLTGSVSAGPNNVYNFANHTDILIAETHVASPIYYDRDNTAYYVDPNGTSRIATVKANELFTSGQVRATGWWGQTTGGFTSHAAEIGASGTTAYLISYNRDTSTYGQLNIEGHGISLTSTASYVNTNYSFRAPIFYDYNDTNYYVDPNGTSIVNRMDFGTSEQGWRNAGANAMTGHSVKSISFAYETANWDNPQNQGITSTNSAGAYADSMSINSYNDVTIRLDSNSNNDTSFFRIYDNTTSNTTNELFYLDSNGACIVTGSFRAPLFYDSNNTGYYVDPNGTSNINSLVATTINRNPVVTLSGDVTGAATMTNLGSINITTTVANDSHTHTSLGSVNFNNGNLTNVNNIVIGDPGPGEGIQWGGGNGWKIYESPDNLTTNGAGNLQFVQNSTRRMTINTSGVDVVGALTATTKSFDIEHPSKKGMRLHHGVLEGPEHGVYVRGKSKEKIIELPDYWIDLVHEDSITVQLTAIGGSQELYVEDIKENKVYVTGTHYFYTIQAERKDVERFEVEYGTNI